MPVRETILDNLVTELKKIKVENGYSISVKTVTRDFKGVDQTNSFEIPTLFVLDDGSEELMREYKEDSTVYSLIDMEVTLVGYIRSNKNLSTYFNKLFADILKKLNGINLGSNVREVKRTDVSNFITVPPNLIFQMPIKVVYFYDKANP